MLQGAAGGPIAVAVEGVATLQVNPGVQQDIAGATVETVDGLARLDQAQVAEPAYVEHGTVAAGVAEKELVEGWNQGCALAAGGHVATAEVADHGDAGELGEQRRVANLGGEAPCGFVAHGLPVTANSADIPGPQVVTHQQCVDAGCCQFDPTILRQRGASQFVRSGGAECQQLAA
ncbi:hypothetical protein D9M69_602590 [compost metagenome]